MTRRPPPTIESKARRALKFLKLNNPADVVIAGPEFVKRCLDVEGTKHYHRNLVYTLIKSLNLHNAEEWQAVWKCKKMRTILSDSMVRLNSSMKFRDEVVREAMRFFCLKEACQMHEISISEMYERISVVSDASKSKRVMYGTNLLLEAIGRPERMTAHEVRQARMGCSLRRTEKEWFVTNGKPKWYLDFKQGFASHVNAVSRREGYAERTIDSFFYIGCLVVRCANLPPTDLTIDKLKIAIVQAFVVSSRRSVLIKQRRGPRHRHGFSPVTNTIVHHWNPLRCFLEYIGYNINNVVNKKDLIRSVERHVEVDLLPGAIDGVNDCLSMEEMEVASKHCRTESEKTVILLLSRLGMRIGAIANLRIYGVIKNSNLLVPMMPTEWPVNDTIVSQDKGNQINTWHISLVPGVRERLSTYINATWRKEYEQWIPEVDGRMKLVEAYLFPSHKKASQLQIRGRQRADYLGKMVRRVLLESGVPQERAHAHAFRKGVVTELLRSGNTLKAVSVFVHHKSVQVTEEAYDKRKDIEILEKMVFPIGFETLVKDVADKETTGNVSRRNVTGARNRCRRCCFSDSVFLCEYNGPGTHGV